MMAEHHVVKDGLSEYNKSSSIGELVSPDSFMPADESSRLRELNADVRNQDDIQRDIERQVSILLDTYGIVFFFFNYSFIGR